MQTILVPLDESPSGEAVLPLVAALAQATGAGLLLVRVPDRPPPGVHAFEVRGGAVAYAEEYLAERADFLNEQGIRTHTATLPEGPVPQAILNAVTERKAGIVAMGTHGRSGHEESAFGSVAKAVLARCTVPVLLARSWLAGATPDSIIEKGMLVLCPVDGSRYADSAGPFARGLAGALGGICERIQVEEPAGPNILAVATGRRAGLIVMTAHGHGAPGKQVLGHVTEDVLRSGTTPLILLGPAVIPSLLGSGGG